MADAGQLSRALEADLDAFRADTAERLARLKPSDTLKGLFVRRYFELFRADGGDDLLEKCLELFGHPRIVDLYSYPYANLVRVGPSAARALVPKHGSVHRWLFTLGREATGSYLKSPLGAAFLAALKPSPKTMLQAMPWAIATCFTFGKRSVVFTGETNCLFRCRFEFSPAPANAGAVQAAVEAAGGREVRSTINAFDLFNYDIELSWQAADG